MRTRWKILIGLAVFVVLATGLAWVTLRLQPESDLETYKKLLRAKGEKLTLSEVLPPPVPPESNSVNVVQTALGMLGSAGDNIPEMMKMIAPGKAMIAWQQPEACGYSFTNTWEEFAATVETNRAALDLLQQAMPYPTIDFQLDYRRGIFLMLPHLGPLKRSARLFSAAALSDLHRGDTASAVTNLCVVLALAREMNGERILISQLVRVAMAAMVTSASWELLQATNVTDAPLARLQQQWEQLEFLAPMANAFLMERVIIEQEINRLRKSPEDWKTLMPGGSGGSSAPSRWTSSGDWWEDIKDLSREGFSKTKYAGAVFMWRTSWSYADELKALKNCQDTLETIRQIQSDQIFQPAYDNLQTRLDVASTTASFYDDIFERLDEFNLRKLFSGISAALMTSLRKTMVAETGKRVVITAIALKRFQLQHGRFPEKLSDLVPQYLTAVPLDAVDGQPLRYRPKADGTYLLYSVGEDGKDDGGDPTNTASGSSSFSWQNPKARDWVWPQPATAAEIQYFREHPPK